jgi:hypothetical protein
MMMSCPEKEMVLKTGKLWAALVVSVAAIHSSFSCAESPRSVDARNFDIASVKTGMAFDEARKAAARHFGISIDQIKPWPPEKYRNINSVTGLKQPSSFSYAKDGIKLSVYFVPRIPLDKARTWVADKIIYEIPWSPQNKDNMEKAALEKYGVQSNAPYSIPMVWCENPNPNPGLACSTGYNSVARLSLHNTTLELVDPAWGKALSKFQQDAETRKPNF